MAFLCAGAIALLAGCLGGGDESESSRIEGGTATIYSSMPLHGVSARAARAVAAGQRRALAEAGGRAGELRIRVRELSSTELSSTESSEHVWDPALVSANAHRAADDPTAIAYLGELDYGASAVSVPITNDAGILQVSPSDGLTSLTLRAPGSARAGPERYYPSGERSFVRVTATDLREAELLLDRVRARGARRLAIVFDQGIYGRELAAQFGALARRGGLEAVRSTEYRGRIEEIPDIVHGLAETVPEAVVYAGVAGAGTGPLFAAIDRRLPGVPAYATSGLLARPPGRPIPAAPEQLEAVGPVPPARDPSRYGYDAMRLVLDAIEVGGRDRRRVIDAALRAGRDRGPGRFALYRLGQNGLFRFVRMVR